MRFIDQVDILLRSGKGGPGCASFASDPLKPRGGPDGGDGGKGGDVIVKINPHLNSLFHLQGKRQLSAKNGLPGSSQNKTGASGSDLVIELPPGTVLRDQDGQLIVDITEGEHRVLAGGRGGKGNSHFRTSVNQAPSHFQTGEPGEERQIRFQLKLLADVGIIGFPNAGKSTLVSALTAARPKIADYPFTTLQPQLGVVKFSETSTFTLADIPGLIEGASQGVGLGHQFLRHIERTRLFIHLLDLCDFSERDLWQDYLTINNELKNYDGSFSDLDDFVPLCERRQIVVFNKVDSASQERSEHYQKIFRDHGVNVMLVSAATRQNLDELLRQVSSILFGEDEDG